MSKRTNHAIKRGEQGEDALAFFLRSVSEGFYGDEDPEEYDTPTADMLAESDLSPLAWAQRYRSLDDRPFTLDITHVRGRSQSFTPLIEIYNDDHPFLVIQKPAQRGLSELAINRACHALDIGDRYWATGKRGLNVGYIFPTAEALRDFSKERFAGLLNENEYLAALFSGSDGTKGYDGITFKQARNSYLYLRGAYAGTGTSGPDSKRPRSGLKSFPADFLILDEFDDMDAAAVALAEKRLLGSTVNRRLYLSTPTFPNRGINALYLRSDMRVWLTPCIHCGQENELDFFRDVYADGQINATWQHFDEEKLKRAVYTVHCPSCYKTIPDDIRFTKGRWEAQRPEVNGIRGYLIPALCFAQCNLANMAVNATSPDPRQVEEFWRQDYGRPFESGGARITADMLKACGAELERGILPAGPFYNTTMGIDIGKRCHYRISSTGPGGVRYIRAMGTVKSTADKTMWQYLSDLIKDFKIRRVVVDALPELDACERWAKKHPGVVYRAFYPNERSAVDLYNITATKEEKEKAKQQGREPKKTIVQINRTAAMDKILGIVKGATQERWPRTCYDNQEVIDNMSAPLRLTIEDSKTGNSYIEWQHSRPDHFFHACVYDRIAYESLPRSLAGGWTAGEATKGWGG